MKKRALAIALALCIAATNAAGALAAEAEGQAPKIVEEEISLEETTETEWEGAEAEPADNAEEMIDQIEEKQEETEEETSESDPETENEQENDPESLETAEENPETETEENIEEPVNDITAQDPSESEKEEPAEGQEHSAAAVGEGTENENTDPAEENSNTAYCQLFDTEVIYNGKEIRPAVEVIYQGTLLEEGTDYQLTYDNNVNVGIGTVTVEAIDNSFEPVTLSFKILPAASKKVTIYNVAQGLKVTWLKVEGATRYNVYRDGELIKTTSVLEITDGDVKYRSGEKFTYKVVATAKDVGESTVARTGTYYRLMPVGIKSVTNPSQGKMTVTYDKSPGSSGYVVRYGLKSDMSDAKVITVKGEDTTSRTFNNLQMNKTYYVQVRTYKIENNIRYYSGYCTTKTVKTENTSPAYQIVYQLNGGTNNSANPAEYTTTSKTITLANPSKKGYIFAGWYSDSKFRNKITEISKGSTGNKTVYARWKLYVYTITYVLNGGKAPTDNPPSYTVTTSDITLKSPTQKGYTFAGWYKDAAFKTRVKSIPKGSTGNLKLYAKWETPAESNLRKLYEYIRKNGQDIGGKKCISETIESSSVNQTFIAADGDLLFIHHYEFNGASETGTIRYSFENRKWSVFTIETVNQPMADFTAQAAIDPTAYSMYDNKGIKGYTLINVDPKVSNASSVNASIELDIANEISFAFFYWDLLIDKKLGISFTDMGFPRFNVTKYD